MSDYFPFDVFLSHSAKDKATVRQAAERLRADGLRVWLDEWEIRPGDSIPAKVELGLEQSRVLVLCMSAGAFGSDWARLESYTFRFRDPLNNDRRFIPLRLDDAPAKGSLAQFSYVDWRTSAREQEYRKLLEACRRPGDETRPDKQSCQEQVRQKVLSLGHTDVIRSVAFSPEGSHALSGSNDKTIRLWDTETGACLRVMEGHSDSVLSVAWDAAGSHALSGSDDKTVRLWSTETGACLRLMEGHSDRVMSVACNATGSRALSGSCDNTVRLWDTETGACLRLMEGHSAGVLSVAWNAAGSRALSGSDDKTIRLWDTETGACLRVMGGHSDRVLSVTWNGAGNRALSGSYDNTVRLWDTETGACLRVMEGHSGSVWSVARNAADSRALSGSYDKTVRLWDTETGACLRAMEGHAASVSSVAWNAAGSRALSGSNDKTVRLWDTETGACLRVMEGHPDSVGSVAWNAAGSRALSGSNDKTVRLWDTETGVCLRVMEGHSGSVWSVAWNAAGSRALSGSNDKTVRLWDTETGICLRAMEGHSGSVWSVARNAADSRALSGSYDKTVRLWDTETGVCLRVMEGHAASVSSVAWNAAGSRALSGSKDNTIRLWDTETGVCLRVMEGHAASVWSVAWNAAGSRVLSGSRDNTVRLWDTETGVCLRVMEGHSAGVLSVAWNAAGSRALSGSYDKTVRLWDTETGVCLQVMEGHSAGVCSVAWNANDTVALSAAANGVMRLWDLSGSAIKSPPDNVVTQYTNAKVLLVGDSGAGKTGLSMRIARDCWEKSESTVGAWATHWKVETAAANGVQREIWLWDFGGQADQRLIHQLYMQDTALAVLVFDGQKEDLFEALGQWDRDITRASHKPFNKLLAAGRVDAGGLRVSRSEIEKFANERGYRSPLFETSAKEGIGCEELKQAILSNIDWEQIPFRSSPLVFRRLKEEIILLKEAGRVLMRFNELRDALRLAGTGMEFSDGELKAVITLLAGPGVVWELEFGSWVLLQPELINAYAQAVLQTLREDDQERGCLVEERVLRGDLKYHSSAPRLGLEEERFILLAMHQTLVERGLCLREQTSTGAMLIFPSYYRRERPDLTGYPAVLVSYQFSGFLDDIYATLVVRLHHTDPFRQEQLWRYAADFRTLTGRQLGIRMTRRAEGAGELEVYFDPAISTEEKIIFSRYVHQHLTQKGHEARRLRHYVCPYCGTPVGNRKVAMERLEKWLDSRTSTHAYPSIICVQCEKRVPLWDDLEKCFADPDMQSRVHKLQEQSQIVLDNESKERALVGEVISTVALAGQISREFNVSDHGIDMEIEFRNDKGEATGKKLYLKLKTGDSYLKRRERDGQEVFTIRLERHARYWMDQQFPVMLVIRNSRGEVRWMEVRDILRQSARQIKRIVFSGSRLDVMSVRHWREHALGPSVKVQ